MSGEKDMHRACPVCDQDAAEPFLEKGALQLVRCRGCRMVYADPVGEEFASGRFYERRSFYLTPEKLESDYAPVRFERELGVFRSWCRSGVVLDVGCSTGAFLHQLNVRHPGDYQVLGVDVPGPALDYARSRGLPVSRQDFLEMDCPAERFDAITFWAVMEHLAYPGRFLSISTQMLKPGGLCFILTPNLGSLAVCLLGPNYRYIMPEHLNYFTSATLKAFASREGAFQVVEARSTHFNPVVIWQDLRSQGRIPADGERAGLLQRTTAWKQSPLLKPLNLLYRGTERILGSMNLADNVLAVLRRTDGR